MEKERTTKPSNTNTPSLSRLYDYLVDKKQRPNANMWFPSQDFLSIEEGTLRIRCPNQFSKEWIEKNYPNVIADAASQAGIPYHRLEVVIDESLRIPKETIQEPVYRQKTIQETSTQRVELLSNSQQVPTTKRLKDLIITNTNQYARDTADEILATVLAGRLCEHPFCFVGDKGSGKTTLLGAIMIELIEQGKIPGYINAEALSVINQRTRGKSDAAMQHLYSSSVVFVDSLEGLICPKAQNSAHISRPGVQRRIRGIIEYSNQHRRNIVFASTTSPFEFAKFVSDSVLADKIQRVQVIPISSPEESRREYIEAALSKRLSGEDVEVLVNHLDTALQGFSAGQIEGVVASVAGVISYRAKSRKSYRPLAISSQILGKQHQRTVFDGKMQEPEAIFQYLAKEMFPNLNVDELRSPSKKRVLVKARAQLMYGIRHARPDIPLARIGAVFGNRDHSTIIHSLNSVSEVTRQRVQSYFQK